MISLDMSLATTHWSPAWHSAALLGGCCCRGDRPGAVPVRCATPVASACGPGLGRFADLALISCSSAVGFLLHRLGAGQLSIRSVTASAWFCRWRSKYPNCSCRAAADWYGPDCHSLGGGVVRWFLGHSAPPSVKDSVLGRTLLDLPLTASCVRHGPLALVDRYDCR